MNWVTIFGLNEYGLNLISLDLNRDPYQLFRMLYANYEDTFILESLTGPREMSEFSIIGFDPIIKFTAKSNDVEIKYRDGSKDSYKTDDPLHILKELMPMLIDHRFRYVGGAVGYISYDSINYWEDIKVKESNYPSMEFGI